MNYEKNNTQEPTEGEADAVTNEHAGYSEAAESPSESPEVEANNEEMPEGGGRDGSANTSEGKMMGGKGKKSSGSGTTTQNR